MIKLLILFQVLSAVFIYNIMVLVQPCVTDWKEPTHCPSSTHHHARPSFLSLLQDALNESGSAWKDSLGLQSVGLVVRCQNIIQFSNSLAIDNCVTDVLRKKIVRSY